MLGPRSCDQCGTTYQPKRASSRYCSDLCRKRHRRATPAPAEPPPGGGAVTEATHRELVGAGLLESWQGAVALVLARYIDGVTPATARALAPLCKEHRACMAAVMEAAPQSMDDPLLRFRRRVRERRASFDPA